MKKIYATGIALLAGLSAMAAPQSASVSQTQVLKSATAEMTAVEAPATMTKADGKAITSLSELVGFGKIVGKDVSGLGNTLNFFLTVEEKNTTTLTLKDFIFSQNDCDVKVDVAAGTVTFKNQTPLGQVNTSEGYKATYLYTREFKGEYEDNKPVTKPVNEIVATLDADNNIVFPANTAVMVGYPTTDNKMSYFACVEIEKIEKCSLNTPTSLDGYENVGTAKFSDGWFNSLMVSEGQPAINNVDVTVMRNPAKPKELVICNPYGDPRWVEQFGRYGDGVGYLIVDYSYEECVTVVPLVASGMASAYKDGSKAYYYLNNQEGINVFNGYSQEDQIIDNEIIQAPMSNVKGNTMTIENLFFGKKSVDDPDGDVDEPLGTYWWTNGQTPEGKPIWRDKIPAVIELPEGWNKAGVEGVYVDGTENVRYYNLQGVEIAAPVKGQLTIKKEGNKAVKFFAR